MAKQKWDEAETRGFDFDGMRWAREICKGQGRNTDKLNGTDRLVLILLASQCGPHHQTYVSQDTLARESGIGQPQVCKVLKKLEKLGLIAITRRPQWNRSNVIFLRLYGDHLEAPPLTAGGLMDTSAPTAPPHLLEKWQAGSKNGKTVWVAYFKLTGAKDGIPLDPTDLLAGKVQLAEIAPFQVEA